MEDVPQPGSLDAEAGIFCSTFDQTGTRLITGGADKTIKVGIRPIYLPRYYILTFIISGLRGANTVILRYLIIISSDVYDYTYILCCAT